MLTSSKLSMAQTGAPITHPPELDLPQSLKAPENIRGDVRVPQEYRCPLGSGVMSQPVVAPSGLTYDRYSHTTHVSIRRAPFARLSAGIKLSFS